MFSKTGKYANRKAFSLLELIFATIIGMAVMLGSIGVLENMQKESNNFQSRIKDDMSWVEANRHLAQMVRSSSYLDIPAAADSTLVLYNYDGKEIGKYVNDTANYKIDYTDKATGAITTFKRVNAAFSALSIGPSGKGWRNNKQVETKVNYTVDYTAPSTSDFTSEASLSCRTAVAGASSTWAATYYGSSQSFGNPAHVDGIARKTTDGGYIYVDTIVNSSCIYVLKITQNGTHEWSHLYVGEGKDIQQTSDGGYIITGRYNSRAFLLKLNSDGSVNWRKPIMSGWPGQQSIGCRVIEADGYVVTAWYADNGDQYPSSAHVIKTDLAGNPATDWAGDTWDYRVWGGLAGGYIGIVASYSTSGGAIDGYVITTGNAIKLSKDKHLAWKTTETTYSGYFSSGLQQVFNAAGGDDGYVIAGWDGQTMCLYRIDSIGNRQWAKAYPSPGGVYYGSAYSVKKIPGGYILSGHPINSSFVAYLVKTNTSGDPIWVRSFDAGTSNGFPWGGWGCYTVECADDGGYLISGRENKFLSQIGMEPQAYFIKTDSDGKCPTADKPTKYTDLPVYIDK